MIKICSLNTLNTQNYQWQLSIDKTNIIIFGSRKDQQFDFNLGGHKIDICSDFKYLAVIYSRNRHFH